MESKKNKKNKFFEVLKAGLEEVLAHEQGKITLHSEVYEVLGNDMVKKSTKTTATKTDQKVVFSKD